MKLERQLVVPPGKKVDLSRHDPGNAFGLNKKDTAETLQDHLDRLRKLQDVLYAERSSALLVVLQAIDGGGKDGTISHVMSGVNPQGCEVNSFKVPSPEEREHDFLWRIHKAVPRHGSIGIFNRSHYEDVLVVRVHNIVKKDVWKKRFEQINHFEQMLAENNVRIVKFFLNISKDEQRRRFEARVSDSTKFWKVNLGDYEERGHWDDYMKAYEDVLSKCSTKWAPWYVIPADKKWFRNLAVSQIIVETLESMNLRYPKPTVALSDIPAEFGGGSEKIGTEHGGADGN